MRDIQTHGGVCKEFTHLKGGVIFVGVITFFCFFNCTLSEPFLHAISWRPVRPSKQLMLKDFDLTEILQTI